MTKLICWQAGKTEASITFVREAELFIEYNTDEADRVALRNAINKLKLGELVFKVYKAPLRYLIDTGIGA